MNSTLVYRFRFQQSLDLVGRLAARTGDDGQITLDANLGVQLTVLHDV